MVPEWKDILAEEFEKKYYKDLCRYVNWQYNTVKVYPPRDEIFTAFRLTPLAEVRAVILGQDPYHEAGQAQGLAFSVRPGVMLPPSLRNIFKEYMDDLKLPMPADGSLIPWAKSGVLLLNTVLTVREHEAGSHANMGWERFTDEVIRILNRLDKPMVFMLWGRYALAKKGMLDNPKHLVLGCAHPSPLSASRGFFGCRHFSKCNEFLVRNGAEPVNWRL